MTSELTAAARTIQQAAEPVLRAMARGDRYERAEVPDLLNTVLEKVLRRLRDGRRIDNLAAYSKQTARNVFNDWGRSKGREQEHTHRDADRDGSSTRLAERLATASLSPSSRVIQRDDQRRHAPMIRRALANLAPSERCVLHLRFIEGRSSAEVADLLGYKSPAVVDTIVSRARKSTTNSLRLSGFWLAAVTSVEQSESILVRQTWSAPRGAVGGALLVRAARTKRVRTAETTSSSRVLNRRLTELYEWDGADVRGGAAVELAHGRRSRDTPRVMFRSPTHAWADRLGRSGALEVIAAAAVATRAAIDALESDDIDLARRLWSSVNGPELLSLWNAPIAAVSPLVAEPIIEIVAAATARPMSLSKATSLKIFERDGYRCRYCAIPVVTRWKNGDVPKLVTAMPDLTPTVRVENGELWGSGRGGALRNVDEAKWMWQKAVADHVVPASRYGPTSLDNLVTACAGCNYEKMGFTLAQLGVPDPRVPAD